MIQLEGLEIDYFRSVYKLKIKNIKDLCVLSGKNDCGKSNILKALNLFFNNETDWQTQLDFSRDFSHRRREQVKRETVKGRQFIRVKLYFIRGDHSKRSLPDKFNITKTWYRESATPEIKTSIESQFKNKKIQTQSLDRAQAGWQNYLNRIRFEYIPAIKDRRSFTHLLGLLQDTILQKRSGESDIENSVQALNKAVEDGAGNLNTEFERACGVKTDIRLPKELAVLFRAFSVETKSGDASLPLTMRGDGIQTRFVPSLLHYIAMNSSLTYIWGFEEPENCLEHSLATALSKVLLYDYSKDSQIFITSHSPAFIALQGDKVSAFRVFSVLGNGTNVHPLGSDSSDNLDSLKEELGLLQLAKEQQKEFEIRFRDLKLKEETLERLTAEFAKSSTPILLTEGKSDPLILNEAWKKLYPSAKMNFRIISCDTSENKDGGFAGAGMLSKAITSCRPDQAMTIALYDRDGEGKKEFNNLGNSFTSEHGKILLKIHKNRNAAVFLIPDIPSRMEYISAENLPIEFLFPDEYLQLKTADGHGLTFEQEIKISKIGAHVTHKEETTEPQYRKIKEGKVLFAERIVPLFPAEAFQNFKYIFDCFDEIIRDLKGHKPK